MKIKNIRPLLLVVAIMGCAFLAGMQLRAYQARPVAVSFPIKGKNSVQASALLKLSPELSPTTLPSANQESNDNRRLISGILDLLRAHYVEPVTPERETDMARGAVQGMLDSLDDPDSRFLNPTERKFLDDTGSGKFRGIGAVLTLKNEKVGDLDAMKIIIIAPMPGSPAEKAGLKSGDSITYINDKWIVTHDPFIEANLDKLAKAVRNKEIDDFTYLKAYEAAFNKLKEGMNISEALDILTTKTSGEISLRIERSGQREPVDLKLLCRNTQVDPVTSSTRKRGIAYIRVRQFNKRAITEFAAELNRAKTNHAKALILDLRGNPGGLMDAAVNIAGKISGGGVMAYIRNNKGRRVIKIPRTRKLGLPVVVLIDSGTTSVAELAAGTLRDSASAVLVGTKTFGDGLTQEPLLLRDGSAAILTTGKMLTAKGFDFNRKGLTPNKKVLQDKRGDAQLEAAEKILLAKLGKA